MPPAPGNRTVRATYTGSDQHAASAQASTTVRMVFPTQDQSAGGDLGPDVAVESHGGVTSSWAQTFTAGRGGQLTDVGFGVAWDRVGGAAPEPLLLTVQTVDGDGLPTGTVLGSGTVVPDEDLPEGSSIYITLALDQPAPIATGTRYALVWETAGQPEEAWGGWDLWTTAGDVYGDPTHRRDATGTWTAAGHDLAFTTWVYDPT